jgi:hypothetical protein
LVRIAFAAWLYEAASQSEDWRNCGIGLPAVAVIGAFGFLYLTEPARPSVAAETKAEAGLPWRLFSQDRISELQAEGRPVTSAPPNASRAKSNERIALADPAVLKAFADTGVATEVC